MSSSSSAPTAPSYVPMENADLVTAAADQQDAAAQLAFAQQQYADQEPLTQQYVQSMVANENEQTQEGQQQQATAVQNQNFYDSTYQPIESQFAKQATNYNSPDMANQQAGAAEANSMTATNTAQETALSNLESYGIDPSQTRYAALDLGAQISGAAAAATAGTQSRVQTYQQGLALEGQAINVGRGYASDITSEYGGSNSALGGAASSGGAGITAANSTNSIYDNLEGTATQYAGLSSGAIGGAIGAQQAGYGDEATSAGITNQSAANTSQGIGSLIGAGLGLAAIRI